jgi:hypothetical protein
MSIDIDMQSYAGASSDPAAGGQQVVDTNSYAQEAQDYPVYQEALDQSSKAEETQDPSSNPQSEHFRALREEVDRIKAEREAEKREHQLQLDMLRANLDRAPQPQSQVQERKFLDGMQESDIPNVGELRREWAQKEAMYESKLEELTTASQHADYAEVLDKYLTPLVRQKPHLAEGIQGARNKSLFAYELGKMAQQMQERQAASTTNENAQRIVENSKKPGTLSQAGGQGALSKADYFASMSDQEFMRFASKNLEGI